jgi:catalase-peroxidase
VLGELEKIQTDFDIKARGGMQISLADVIVLAGAAAIEKAAEDAGVTVQVPFVPGRSDASQVQTDVKSFALLEPSADGFRNFFDLEKSYRSPAEMRVDKADQLHLTVPEMTALIGGMWVLDANTGGAKHGVFTDAPGTLSNDFFVNLLDMSTVWRKAEEEGVYQGLDRETGVLKYTGTTVDLIFGSNSELRAVAEVYAFDGSQEKFVKDFVAAWNKVMELDRFDLKFEI